MTGRSGQNSVLDTLRTPRHDCFPLGRAHVPDAPPTVQANQDLAPGSDQHPHALFRLLISSTDPGSYFPKS
jgi:hypothetical protein